MERVIWNSSLDLSPDGVDAFCNRYASDFGKTPDQLKAMSLMDLATTYMWTIRAQALRAAKELLDFDVGAPIVVFSHVAEFMTHRVTCSLLDRENLNEIFRCRQGLSTKFYTDGCDLRCDDLSDDGMTYHIFRAVTNPQALGECVRACQSRGELPTREEMDRCSRALAPDVQRLYAQKEPRRMAYATTRPSREAEYHR